MRLNIDKRYFGEYIPHEQCECDCGRPDNHRYFCASRTGLFRIEIQNSMAPSGLKECFLPIFKETLIKNSLYKFLNNHGLLDGEQEARVSETAIPADGGGSHMLKFLYIADPSVDKYIINVYFSIKHCPWFVTSAINISMTKYTATGCVYLKVVFYNDNYDYEFMKSFIDDTNTNDYKKKYGDSSIGKKQLFLGVMKITGLYNTVIETILADVLNEIAPQFFNEQG